MRFLFFLFSVCVVMIHGNAQSQPYYDGSLYPVYPYPNYYPVVDGRIKSLGNDQRFLFGSLFTSTTTTITTTTTTCTVSTANACNTARRKRSVLEEDDENIEPSPVNE